MKHFGTPGSSQAAGTYVKLLVKTAKYVKPFSRYLNEEEYLTDFNTAFKVLLGNHCALSVALRLIAGFISSSVPRSAALRGSGRFTAAQSRFHHS
jgi:hypothetical protein